MIIHLFEDDLVEQLRPITTMRPAYFISCGGACLYDRARQAGAAVLTTPRPWLRDVERCDALADDEVPVDSSSAVRWLLNGRLVPHYKLIERLTSLPTSAKGEAYFSNDALAAARLPDNIDKAIDRNLAEDPKELIDWIEKQQLTRCELTSEIPLLEYSHDVIRFHQKTLADNLIHSLGQRALVEIADGVFAASDFRQPTHWECDTSQGPILLQSGCQIGPFTLLQGPLLVGRGAKVNEHAALKDGVTLGHTTKVGGEVEATIIEPYSNKQHYGFLGHSYVGSWVNLGAGTCNSDLKNTYGNIRMTYGSSRVDSGMQFMGCVVGDYVKTSIQTTIFTGKMIDAFSMVYGHVAENVVPFTNYAKQFGSVTQVSPDVMQQMQQRMFHRRGKTQQPCHIELIRRLFDATMDSRQGLETSPPAL